MRDRCLVQFCSTKMHGTGFGDGEAEHQGLRPDCAGL